MRGVCTASSDAGRGAVAGRGRRRCGARSRNRRSKPLSSRRASRAPLGPPTSWPQRCRSARAMFRVPQRWKGEPKARGSLKRSVHRGRNGANQNTRCAERREKGGLALLPASTGLDVARRRGARVPRDPGVPRTLLFFEARARSDDGVPGAFKKCGR